MDILIDVSNLHKSFEGKDVVNGVSLRVKKGEVFGFLGPNGSGKTTTIRMLCGLLTPDQGHGSCLGFDLHEEAVKIKEQVGYMTQKFSFYGDLSVEENLNFIARVYRLKKRKKAVAAILTEMGLEPRKAQLTATLSGGWKQRMALAACLLHKPKLLLLDEPTAGVDPMARREFWDKIHLLSEQGVTTLVSTHYMDEAERCTRLAYLAEGKLLMTGTMAEVIKETKLLTWSIYTQVTTSLLQKLKSIPGVIQAALFGSQIHVCGYDKTSMEQRLNRLAKEENFAWKAIDTTLEDAFISLVNASKREKS